MHGLMRRMKANTDFEQVASKSISEMEILY